MPLSYNPLLAGKLDINKKNLNDLEDVNTAGTVNGKVLAFQSGTWIPAAVGAGDMLKSDYVTGQGTVYNASRLEGETLATVQAHGVDAGTITQGTIGLARVPVMDDAHIPDLETLSYGGAFGTAQVPLIGAYKVASGTLGIARIPTMDDAHIPNLETLSYGGTFATAQIPNLPTSKITTGTFNVNRIETLDNIKGTVTAAKVAALGADKITTGTFGLARVPTMDDAHVPDLETLSYGAAFGTAQIPSLGAYKTTSGTINADRIPALPTTRITSGTFNAGRIPILPTDRYGSAVLVSGTRSLTGDFDFAKHQAKAMALEVLGSAPASPATAQLYYNTGDDKVYVYVA